MEAVWAHFSLAYAYVERNIQSGKLGEVKFIEADYGIVSPTTEEADELCSNPHITGALEQRRVTLEQPFHFPDKVIDVDGTTKNYALHPSDLPYNFTNSPELVYQPEVARCIRAGLIESPRMIHQDRINLAILDDTVRKQLGVNFEADDKEYPESLIKIYINHLI